MDECGLLGTIGAFFHPTGGETVRTGRLTPKLETDSSSQHP